MLKSSNAQVRQQDFTIKVTQREDGKFEATTPNVPGKSAVGKTFQIAASQLNKQLQEAVNKGEIS
jgi:predicted RNase H-like HicB family nuclease